MKKMFLFVAAVFAMTTTSLMAKYELFTSYTKPLNKMGKIVKSEIVFSGEYEDYQKTLANNRKIGAGWGAMTGAMSAGMAGAGVGVLLVAVTTAVTADEQFIQITKLTDHKGNSTLKAVMMMSNKYPSYSVEEANKIMQGAK